MLTSMRFRQETSTLVRDSAPPSSSKNAELTTYLRRLQLLPYLRFYRNPLLEILFPDFQGTLTRITHIAVMRWFCSLNGSDYLIGHLLGIAASSNERQVTRDKYLRQCSFPKRVSRDLMGGKSARQKGGQQVEHQCQPGTFPVTDWQRSGGCLNSSRIASELAV